MAGARENDPNRLLIEAYRQRVEKRIDWRWDCIQCLTLNVLQIQMPIAERRDDAGGNHQNLVGDDGGAIMRLGDRHGRPACQDFRQQASAPGREMQHDDKGQPTVGRHLFEKTMKRINPTRRSTDANDGDGRVSHCCTTGRPRGKWAEADAGRIR